MLIIINRNLHNRSLKILLNVYKNIVNINAISVIIIILDLMNNHINKLIIF